MTDSVRPKISPIDNFTPQKKKFGRPGGRSEGYGYGYGYDYLAVLLVRILPTVCEGRAAPHGSAAASAACAILIGPRVVGQDLEVYYCLSMDLDLLLAADQRARSQACTPSVHPGTGRSRRTGKVEHALRAEYRAFS